MCWKKKQTNMKDRLLFSERDIKDTDANSRSKERSIFKSLQVQDVVRGDTQIDAVQSEHNRVRLQR